METVHNSRTIRLLLKYWEYHRHTDALKLPMHSHLFWQLNAAESGTADFIRDKGGELRLNAGDLLFVPPRVPHLLRYTQKEFVGFSFKLEIHGIDDCGMQPIHIPSSQESLAGLRALRELLTATFPHNHIFAGENLVCDNTDYNTTLVESLLLGFFLRYVFGDSEHGTPFLRQIRKQLQQRHGLPLPVSELAQLCGYSPGHLSELIRQECGTGAKTLIDRERARMAARFLEFSDMKINEIAEHMGFSSLFAFSNFFHRHHGFTPTAWRKEKRNELDSATGPAIQDSGNP